MGWTSKPLRGFSAGYGGVRRQGDRIINWEAIGALGEIIGGAGVIVTLLYLSLQVRASTVASKVESKLAASRMYSDFLRTLIESPEINDVFVRGREDFESLNSEEFYRFSNMAFQSFSLFSAGYFQFSRRTLSESDWFETLSILRFWLRGNGCRQWWVRLGVHMYGSEFVAFVESEMRAIDARLTSQGTRDAVTGAPA